MNPINFTGYDRAERAAWAEDSSQRPGGPRKMKAKIHAVTVLGQTFLVYGITKKGAIRDALEHVADDAHAVVATGEQIFNHGRAGGQILGEEKYRRVEDPNQMGLTGIPESVPVNQADEE